MRILNLIIILTLFFLLQKMSAQELIPLNKDSQSFYEAAIYGSDSSNVHTSIKPYISDTLLPGKNLIDFRKKNFNLIINPIVNSVYQISSEDNANEHLNSGGVAILSHLNKNLFFQGYTFFNSQRLSEENSQWADNNNVVPHFGRFNKNKNYNYPIAGGILSWNSSKHFNFQVGRHKNFWGDGYRSLLLSDNSNLSNFLNGTVKVWKFQYSILYSWFKDDFSSAGSPGFENKYSSSHYLSWNIGKKINVSFFETVVWPGKDSVGNRGFDINYMNPIVFFRPVEFSLGSPDNILMGLGFRYRWFKNHHLYSQFFIDEFKIGEIRAGNGWWGNKYGFQAGLRGFIKNWHYLLETNLVRPYTYSHHTAYCNYGSYNQPFAHPLGANFKEIIFVTRYFSGKWNFSLKAIMASYGVNYSDSLNVGQDIYQAYDNRFDEYNNFITQGKLTKLSVFEIKAQYYFNLRLHFALETGIRIRNFEQTSNKTSTPFVFIGIRTGLFERGN